MVLTFEIWDQINPKYDVKHESALLVYSSGIISNLQSLEGQGVKKKVPFLSSATIDVQTVKTS